MLGYGMGLPPELMMGLLGGGGAGAPMAGAAPATYLGGFSGAGAPPTAPLPALPAPPNFDPTQGMRGDAKAQMLMAMGAAILGAGPGNYMGAMGGAGAAGQQAYMAEIARQQQLMQQDFRNESGLEGMSRSRRYDEGQDRDRAARREAQKMAAQGEVEAQAAEDLSRQEALALVPEERKAEFSLYDTKMLRRRVAEFMAPEEPPKPTKPPKVTTKEIETVDAEGKPVTLLVDSSTGVPIQSYDKPPKAEKEAPPPRRLTPDRFQKIVDRQLLLILEPLKDAGMERLTPAMMEKYSAQAKAMAIALVGENAVPLAYLPAGGDLDEILFGD